jgi:hypothetical protein
LVHSQWWSKVVCQRSFIHLVQFILVFSRTIRFLVFDAPSLFMLCMKGCPASVNTFNHSHKFVQLSLALNPAMFTKKSVKAWHLAWDVSAEKSLPTYTFSTQVRTRLGGGVTQVLTYVYHADVKSWLPMLNACCQNVFSSFIFEDMMMLKWKVIIETNKWHFSHCTRVSWFGCLNGGIPEPLNYCLLQTGRIRNVCILFVSID